MGDSFALSAIALAQLQLHVAPDSPTHQVLHLAHRAVVLITTGAMPAAGTAAGLLGVTAVLPLTAGKEQGDLRVVRNEK